MEHSGTIIKPILKSLSKWRKFGYKRIIQNSDFEYGVKIINLSEKEFKGGKIRNVAIIPFNENLSFEVLSDKIFPTQSLQKGGIHEIWFDRAKSPISGSFWLYFELETKNKVVKFTNIYFNIKDENTLHQEITNLLLVVLTIVASITSILGIFF